MKDIKFTKTTESLGRNGLMKTTGVSILLTQEKNVNLAPITSKGLIGRCYIEIPVESFLEAASLIRPTNTDRTSVLKDLRDFAAKEGLSLEQATRLSNLLNLL